jgi:predicted metal-dependent hydrolase
MQQAASGAGKAVTELFKLGDIPIEVEYKPVKHLRITVYPPDGRVRISAPFHTTRESIRDFVVSKLRWIEKHRARLKKHSPRDGDLEKGVSYVWGTAYELNIIEGRGRPKVKVEDRKLVFSIRPDSPKEKKQEVLDKWGRRMLRETALGLIKKWEPLIGVSVKELYLRKMKSHWGSCSYERQTIRLNTELVKMAPQYLEYVIVHELIHLIEPAHNGNFYRLMNKFMPAWKTIRKEMNSGAV